MRDRKLLLTTELRGDELRLRVRKTVGGSRRPVLHVSHGLTPYASRSGPSGPSGPEDENDQHDGQIA